MTTCRIFDKVILIINEKKGKRMKKAYILLATSAFAFIGVGCESKESNQVGGGLLGATAGAVIGAQFGGGVGQLVAVGVGTLAGAFIGSEIGKHITPSDHRYADERAYHTLETGKSSRWHNPESRHWGEMTAGPRVKQNGKVCRQYTQTIYIDGKPHTAHGFACRQADGSWRLNK